MLKLSLLALAVALLMFPQIAETLYSPVLTDISEHFRVTAEQASLTLSLYFIGFAAGVLVWGRLCDTLGRRPALLLGLAVYALSAVVALLTHHFTVLLLARVCSAFGAAACSVVVQTLLRDKVSGAALTRLFNIIGIALAISPAIGVFSGGLLATLWGYQGVFSALALLAFCLLLWTGLKLEETRPTMHSHSPLLAVGSRMIQDKKILLATLLVALWNVSLFSYYSLAPFIFATLKLSASAFGLTGLVLAGGSLLGAQINRLLLKNSDRQTLILLLAGGVNLLGGVGVWLCSASLWFLLPMLLVMVSFSMAIPVILSSALSAYGECRGTAGALFGLGYYALIGAGLAVSGMFQNLGATLVICALVALVAARAYRREL
ncbi:MFS transporter [Enterobacter sp. CC120223-11]|uniref:MFS transporter n=1 Tax=Enterobacter sp. CC120223-11 TaxID=1378073 RepID=UPI000BD35F5E|nr:MFS transporter [Enterobacter sp. CC120223-11]SNY68248.1 Predicted arabinose efflux permease, MFS family [Enterobacter sp. CC120223-11]